MVAGEWRVVDGLPEGIDIAPLTLTELTSDGRRWHLRKQPYVRLTAGALMTGVPEDTVVADAEGIPVLLKGGGGDPYQIGPAHVFVPAGYEVQARLVLETLET